MWSCIYFHSIKYLHFGTSVFKAQNVGYKYRVYSQLISQKGGRGIWKIYKADLKNTFYKVHPVFYEGPGRQELVRSYPEGKVVLRSKLSMSVAAKNRSHGKCHSLSLFPVLSAATPSTIISSVPFCCQDMLLGYIL